MLTSKVATNRKTVNKAKTTIRIYIIIACIFCVSMSVAINCIRPRISTNTLKIQMTITPMINTRINIVQRIRMYPSSSILIITIAILGEEVGPGESQY